MGIERNRNMTNEELIRYLKAVLETESEKPAAEMDVDLIDECVDYLMELENRKQLTDAEVEEAISKIFAKPQKTKKSKPQYKALLIAACVAALILAVNIFALASGTDTLSLLRQFGSKVVEMFEGESFVVEDKETIKGAKAVSYDSIEEFLKEENPDVLYPTVLPGDAKISRVSISPSVINGEYSPEYKNIFYAMDDQDISVVINSHPNYPKGFLNDPNAECNNINGFECYFVEDVTFAQCYLIHKDRVYVIKAQTVEDVKIIINNLKENT